MTTNTVSYSQLEEILKTAASEPASQYVEFVGSGNVYPLTFRIGELAAAAIAASAVQSMRLWEMRYGRTQEIQVNADAAAEAMRGHRYIRRLLPDGTKEPLNSRPQRDPSDRAQPFLARMFKTKDGRWMYFRSGFRHHADAVARVLGCDYIEDELVRAVSQWEGEALEDAVTAGGGCGGMIRTYAEWDAHEQGKALASLPLFEITKIGDSPPEPLPEGDRPLSGIRALDLTRVLAGPASTRTLAEHGAEVLRVGTDRFPEVQQAYSPDCGHGKRSTHLDVRTQSGIDQLKTLVRGADVFAQGYRPGSLAAKGLGPAQLSQLRPGLIYLSISAFGRKGPWNEKRGFGSITASVSGIADECSLDGVPRTLLDQALGSTSPEDFLTGYLAGFAVMVALERRAREGGSYHVELSIARSARWMAEQPRLDPASVQGITGELKPASIEAFMTTSETPFGTLSHMGPVARMSETQPRWDYPTVPLDHDPPEWLDMRGP